MDEARFMARLGELKVPVKPAGAHASIAIGPSGAELSIAVRDGRLHLGHVFAPAPVQVDVETLVHLLELNGELTVYSVVVDELNRVALHCAWELDALTDHLVGFLILEMFAIIDYLRDDIASVTRGADGDGAR